MIGDTTNVLTCLIIHRNVCPWWVVECCCRCEICLWALTAITMSCKLEPFSDFFGVERLVRATPWVEARNSRYLKGASHPYMHSYIQLYMHVISCAHLVIAPSTIMHVACIYIHSFPVWGIEPHFVSLIEKRTSPDAQVRLSCSLLLCQILRWTSHPQHRVTTCQQHKKKVNVTRKTHILTLSHTHTHTHTYI